MKTVFTVIVSVIFLIALITVFFSPYLPSVVGGLMLSVGLIMRVYTRGVNEYKYPDAGGVSAVLAFGGILLYLLIWIFHRSFFDQM